MTTDTTGEAGLAAMFTAATLWLDRLRAYVLVATTQEAGRFVTRVRRQGLVVATVFHATRVEAESYHHYRTDRERTHA